MLRVALIAGILAGSVAETAHAQSLTLSIRPGKVLLGDPVIVDVTARLDSGQELVDRVPRPLIPPPDGVQYLRGDSLRADRQGTFHGTVRFAFYRLGNQPVPTLALLYRPRSDQPIDTLVHQPVSITVSGLAPPGSPQLKDIRPLADVGPPRWAPLLVLLLVVLTGVVVIARTVRRERTASAATVTAIQARTPFNKALAELDRLDAQARVGGDGVPELYSSVRDILRAALVDARMVGSASLTTPELSEILPRTAAEAEGAARMMQLLAAGDLVRFAAVRPDRDAAMDHLAAARRLLSEWNQSARFEVTDAVR
ncbi:MAG TPA: hypothetical protein VLB12_09175 [Gemmatimonadales bacterium]|nr:hypothetical protein [Gemmatimonadales bacterium]